MEGAADQQSLCRLMQTGKIAWSNCHLMIPLREGAAIRFLLVVETRLRRHSCTEATKEMLEQEIEFFDPDETSSDEPDPPPDGVGDFLCEECETSGDCCSLVHTQDWITAPVDALIGREFEEWLPARIFGACLFCVTSMS